VAKAAKLLKAAGARITGTNGAQGPNGTRELTDADRQNMARMEERLITAPRPALENRARLVEQIVATTRSVCINKSLGDHVAWGATIRARLVGLRKRFHVDIEMPDGTNSMVCDLIVREFRKHGIEAKISKNNSITIECP
jgi:hypothetical protein